MSKPKLDMDFWVNMPRAPYWSRIMGGVKVPARLRVFNVPPKDYAWFAFCLDACWHYGLLSPSKEEALSEDKIETWESALDWIDDQIIARGGDILSICDEMEMVVSVLGASGGVWADGAGAVH